MSALTDPGTRVGFPDLHRGRVQFVDAARGLALVGMIVFHIARDLEMLNVIAPGTTLNGFWYVFARLIAGSFLVLVGVSLVLAHRNGIRWKAFGWRALVILAAALAVSAATYAAMPDRFIYFGILHAILFASCAGLLLVQAQAWMSMFAAGLVLVVWFAYGRALPLDPWFGWTGLAARPRPALDLIPVFPWLAATFVGIAIGRTFTFKASRGTPGPVEAALGWLGRHSLAVYLLHQPLLIGVLWLIFQAFSWP